ncbi:aromatic ring-hydroxylating oxygenase subunit alpha [Sinobacterium norvegicum]|nr:aromatic ring-hydroxylating dioxygenase subunit alpha [Sinobacterium norvegicum]
MADAIPPPPALLAQSQQFLGDEDIPVSRYTSRAFFQREVDSLWRYSWQWACREEHIPDEGDNYVYNIGPYSVIIVRVDDDTIKAFVNSCTHRGTRLLASEGCGYSQGFTCPFHGWSWQLDGSIKNIPGRWDFPHVNGDSHGLAEVSCERWGGFVFINIDPKAKPLADYLGPMDEHFKQFPLQQRRIKTHVKKLLPANWKVAQEAFMEAYHNFETHDSPHGANAQYDIFSDYVSRFIHNIGHYSPEALADYPGEKWRAPPLTEQQQLEALAIEGRVLKDGETARQIAAQTLRETISAELGVDLEHCSDSVMLDSIEYHLFPNMFFFPGVMIPMVYRFRPNGDDVDSCIFDIMVMELMPENAEHPEPPEPIELGIDQSYTDAKELGWLAPVYDEDTSNLQMQTLGLKGASKGVSLGNYQESRIRRVHKTLDNFMKEHEQPSQEDNNG